MVLAGRWKHALHRSFLVSRFLVPLWWSVVPELTHLTHKALHISDERATFVDCWGNPGPFALMPVRCSTWLRKLGSRTHHSAQQLTGTRPSSRKPHPEKGHHRRRPGKHCLYNQRRCYPMLRRISPGKPWGIGKKPKNRQSSRPRFMFACCNRGFLSTLTFSERYRPNFSFICILLYPLSVREFEEDLPSQISPQLSSQYPVVKGPYAEQDITSLIRE